MHIFRFNLIFIIFLFSTFLLTPLVVLGADNEVEKFLRNEERLLQEQQRAKEFEEIKKEREYVTEPQIDDLQPESSTSDKNCFKIRSIKLEGVQLFSVHRQQKITKDYIGKCFSAVTLANLVKLVTNYYYNKGYTTTQIMVPKQNIKQGALILQVIEGRVSKVILNDNKATDNIQKFTAFGDIEDEFLNINDINQGIYQINRLNSQDAKMKIIPADKVGYSDIIVTKEQSYPVKAKIGYDNLGSDFTGIRKTNLSGSLDNLLFLNEQIDLSYSTNLDDPSNEKESTSFSASLSVPYRYNTISYNYSRSTYKGQTTNTNNILTMSGYSDRNNISIERLLLNNQGYRIAGNLSLTGKESGSYINGTKLENSTRRTIGDISFSISKYFQNGLNIYLKPSYVRGLKLLNADQDAAGAGLDIPKAQFQLFKFYGNIAKKFQLQNIPINFTSQIDSQISQDTLFGSEQFSVGGYYSVRGFREDSIAGDHGYYIRNELSVNLADIIAIKNNTLNLHKFRLKPFYDYGYVKTKYDGSSGRLSGAGIKNSFSGKYLNASVTFSWGTARSRLINSDKAENKMIYFELSLNTD